MQKNIIGGWTAEQNGQAPCSAIEYLVIEMVRPDGQKWKTFEIFKPFIVKTGENVGQKKKSFSFPLNQHRQLIDRINHLVMNFGTEKGVYVFQPAASANPGIPQPYGYPQQPTQAPAYPPTPTQPPLPYGQAHGQAPAGYGQAVAPTQPEQPAQNPTGYPQPPYGYRG